MTRARTAALAIAVCLAAVALLLVRLDRQDGAPEASDGRRTAQAIVPQPTPTATPPWHNSVLAAAVPHGPGHAVALFDVGGDGPARELVSGFDELGHLAWSPDGDRLAFAARQSQNWDIFEVGRDGTGLLRLTEHAGYDAWPTWSPDGSQIAFSSYRDGDLDLYRLDTDGGSASRVTRLTEGGGRVIEPAWSPDGEWIAFSAWNDGAYRLEAVDAAGEDRRVVVDNQSGADLRSPTWTGDGRSVVYLERRHGPGQVVAQSWSADGGGEGSFGRPSPHRSSRTLAVEVEAFTLFPDGDALATLSDQRSSRLVDVREGIGVGRRRIAELPPRSGGVSWTRGPMPAGLAEATMPVDAAISVSGNPDSGAIAETDARLGLVALADVRVPGARINAGLADDFAALRAEVRDGTGADFLGTLADMWRPLGYDGSSFFSWHKTGRAFDTQMEFRGPGGRRNMALVRDDTYGRTMWRMFLLASEQDGSVGRPLVEPGWTFAAGGGGPELMAEGGKRGSRVPDGYWFDFTAAAESYGWQRIPSITRGDLNWRRSWTGIDYWHYERRDGLRWFEAARQVYSDEELDAELRAERLRERGITFGRLSRLGFPSGWFSGS